MNEDLKPYIAELIATFTLCFVGAGSIIINSLQDPNGVGLLGIAVAHGLALAIAASATMNISGAHINPAVTIGFVLIKRCTPKVAVGYIIAQLIGASIAGLGLKLLFPAETAIAAGMGTPALGAGIQPGAGVALEIIATFLLTFGIYGTAAGGKAPTGLGGFGIGLTVAFLILAFGPLTGAAMNPARHFGTAIFAGAEYIKPMWIYWVGPIIGAVVGFQVFSRILEKEE